MSAAEWLFVAFGLLVLAVNAGAVYVAWWALFKDRSRGRRRCPRCWHDLGYTPGMTCGECGFFAQNEDDLARTRRRWGHAALAILSCVAVSGAAYWIMAERGWASYVPTRSLIAMLPTLGDLRSSPYRELSRRVGRGRLTERQWLALIKRCAKGDWWTRPVSDKWIDKYGTFLETRRRRIARNDELEWDEGLVARLRRIPPQVELTMREVWPNGTTPWARFQMRDWWPLGSTCRITVTPQLEGAQPISFYRSGRPRPWAGYHFRVPQLAGHSGETRFEIEVEREEDGDQLQAERWRLIDRQTLAVVTRFADPGVMTLEAIDGPALQEAIRAAFRHGAVRWPSGPTPVRFRFDRYPTNTSDFEETALGVRVEALRGDQVARTLCIWWRARAEDPRVGWAVQFENPELLAMLPSRKELRELRADGQREEPAWSMRITGDRQIALRAGGGSRYWSGQVTVPLEVHDRDEPAPPLAWRRE